MQNIISDALKNQHSDYIEIRIEETENAKIQYRGRDLEDIGRSTSRGGNVRALVNGGWGFVSFNDLYQLREKVDIAVQQAKLVGTTKSQLACVKPIVDTVTPHILKDPRSISLEHKKKILDEYNNIIYSVPQVQTSVISYGDSFKKTIFANSEGSYIEQSRIDVTARIAAIARHDGDVQQAGISVGNLSDFSFMENLHSQVKEVAKKAVDLLSAPKVKGGEYIVVLDPILAGVFIHEAFGHLSESDFLYDNKPLREVMVLGRKFGEKLLNVVDGGAVPGLRGSYKYDDEGVPSTKTYLIREGVLTGRLHSRETAAKMDELPTGNARAIDYRFYPIVRMSNTFIEPGKTSFKDMISEIDDGIYAKNWYGGMTSMEMFTFSAGEAYMIRKGKIAELIRPVVLTGNVFTTMHNIDAIGNDLDMNQGGGCGKGGQSPLPVSNGSPHIRIRKCLIGGK